MSRRKTLDELRQEEDVLLGKMLRTARKLEEVRASRKRAEKRAASETVLARYYETNALAVPCGQCHVDAGAQCISIYAGTSTIVEPHKGRVVAAGIAKSNEVAKTLRPVTP